jgi:hypothetical protein
MNATSCTIIVCIDAFNLIYDSTTHEIISVLDLEKVDVTE